LLPSISINMFGNSRTFPDDILTSIYNQFIGILFLFSRRHLKISVFFLFFIYDDASWQKLFIEWFIWSFCFNFVFLLHLNVITLFFLTHQHLNFKAGVCIDTSVCALEYKYKMYWKEKNSEKWIEIHVIKSYLMILFNRVLYGESN